MTTGFLGDIVAPERSALLIVDLQNDYLHEDGAFAKMGEDTTALQKIIPAVNELLDIARSADVPRIFVRQTHSAWFNTQGWLARGRGSTVLPVDRIPLVEDGTWGAEFFGVEPRDDELVITKHRYNGFEYTPLELALRAKEKDTTIFCGAATNVCVKYTALGALFRGFHPILVRDCVATGDPELQATALREFSEHIGNVVELDDIRDVWGRTTYKSALG